VIGYNGTYASGKLSGAVPKCPTSFSGAGIGSFVQVEAWSGKTLAGAIGVPAQPDKTAPYSLVLMPGRYRLSSPPSLSKEVIVRAGRSASIGFFGACTSPPTTATTVPSAGGVTTTTTTTTAPAAEDASAPQCTDRQLSVSALKFEEGLSNAAEVLALKNISAHICTLNGYPGVAALDAHGDQVDQARRMLFGAYFGGQNTGSQPLTVPLGPGQVASATVDGSDNPVGTAPCAYYPAFLVTVPDETHSITIAGVGGVGPNVRQGFPGCSPLVVTPVVAGDSGTYP
jgi:hypothetical protein